MLFRHNIFWRVLMIVLAILILLILSIAVFAPKPEPINSGKAKVLPLKGLSTVVAIMPPAQESPEVKIYIDFSDRIGKCQKIAGWIYIENQETRGQKVYVQLEKPDGTVVHYSTMSIERPDVGAYYKNPLYNTSGFSALIPLKDGFDINACTIRFVVKNKNGTYKSPIWKAGIRFSSRARISVPETESQMVIFSVETSGDQGKGISAYRYLSGWVYITDQQTKGQKVYVQLEKPDGTVVHYSTTPVGRPDVGTGLKNQLYNTSGFSALIPLKDGFDINACTIRFVVKNKNGTYKSPIWQAGIRAGSPAGKMSVFVLVNWLLVIITGIALLVTIWRDRSLLLKPSIMLILFFHVLCQWGTALQAGRIELFLPKPWIFVLLSQGFPIIGLAVSLLTCRRSARALWGRIIDHKPSDVSRKNKALILLAILFILFMFLYLSHVPFRSTGLYKIVFSHSTPAESYQARELSVKFLDNTFLRYGHNIMMAVFAPLLAVLSVQILLFHGQRRNWLWVLFYLVSLAVILLAVSISGARSYSAGIMMVIIFALLLRRGFPMKPIHLTVVVLLILAFPTMLSLLREGKVVTAKNFFEYLRGSTLNRVLIIPMETGLYHVQYAQEHGFFGIQAIPKLAAILGIKPLNVPNFIAQIMSGLPKDTTTANTAYIYAYYSYFGLSAFIPCLFGLWLLDLSLLVYRRLSDNLLIPCIACIAIATSNFSSVEYTVSLFSFGFLFILLVSWAVDSAITKMESIAKKKTL